MTELEFSLEQDLEYDDAIESMFSLLDFFAESDSFDEVEWDDEEEVAFVANEDLEVEITLNEGAIDVFAQIYADDLSKHEIRRNLEEDISRHFGLERSRRSRKRNWREDRSFDSTSGRRERSSDKDDAPKARRQGSGRFGRLRPMEPEVSHSNEVVETTEETTEEKPRRGGSKRLRRRNDSGDGSIRKRSDKKKGASKGLPVRGEDSAEDAPEETKAQSKSLPTKDSKEAHESVDVKSEEKETKAEAPKEVEEKKDTQTKEDKPKDKSVEEPAEDEVLQAKGKDSKTSKPEKKDSAKSAVAKAEPTTPEKKGGGGIWWILLLLALAGGLVALFLSPFSPLNK
ncbi:MAG: hypothetical protein EP343_19565 [Deltaproteobacteria bacterium]|nr:MAG: hypothetical protein EP343_19565 [Deltaproteobacteria bacterium]